MAVARRSTAHWPRVRGDAGVSRPRARAAGRARRYVGTRCSMTRTGDRAAGSRTVRRPHHCCAAACLCSRKSLPSAVAASRSPRLGIVSSRGLGVACRPGWKPGCAGPARRVYGLRGVRTTSPGRAFLRACPLVQGHATVRRPRNHVSISWLRNGRRKPQPPLLHGTVEMPCD